MNALRKRLSNAIANAKLRALLYKIKLEHRYLLLKKRWVDVKIWYHERRVEKLERQEMYHESQEFQRRGNE